MRQLATVHRLDELPNTPPPLMAVDVLVAPHLNVNPINEALFVSHAHRTALAPVVGPFP
jgi:hypothetical protein